jgi:hypothetical protein
VTPLLALDVGLKAPEERWRLAMHTLLKQQTVPMLVKAIDHLSFLVHDPMLAEPLRANARLTAIRIAESAVLLECFVDRLADPIDESQPTPNQSDPAGAPTRQSA